MGRSNLCMAVAPTSSNPSIVSVPPKVNVPAGALYADFPVAANAEGQALITATLNGGAATAAVTVSAPEIVVLTLSPNPASAYAGEGLPFTATGTLTNGTAQDFTTRVAWTSSDTTIATTASTGVASALAPGQTTISASFTFTPVQTGQPVTMTSATRRAQGSNVAKRISRHWRSPKIPHIMKWPVRWMTCLRRLWQGRAKGKAEAALHRRGFDGRQRA